MLARTAEGDTVGGIEAFRPEHLPKHYGMQAGRPVQAVRRTGAGNPADAPAAPDRPGAGQDRQRVQRSHVAHRRPARHPGQAGARHRHHHRRNDGDR